MHGLSTTYSLIYGISGQCNRPSDSIPADTKSQKSLQIEAYFAELALAAEIFSKLSSGNDANASQSTSINYLEKIYEKAGMQSPTVLATNYFVEVSGRLRNSKSASTMTQKSSELTYAH